MITSHHQDSDFLEKVIGENLLELAIAWIQRNLEPEDVFTDKQLRGWALDSDFIEKE